ncbi:tRNA dimethylallyltransferase [Candidatus Kinetoplastibacterium sorsogonicusi]|uniref:tRNA dimethylallyltransferase n=1 Tax=Candidatus Kinetoplastidibacterium kentomonadis TaxID=1576550 RepID=A0A3Q8EYC5_9PROT|nr:tRNA (adenosine(37)-N6)-dimethylallyltransferase MiaA [Candidatus Kinetoplastibacterium sorsogonicusi]AWD32644.1 tRNA dimethylallyltransferase [Candidatus Kinetoplastibacterium sorsogonicusi]
MNKIICIIGPTASGKSSLIKNIANIWPIEVINMDSATIYKGMDIGTAKPSTNERRIIKHHLIDIVNPFEYYSVANFSDDVEIIINNAKNRNKIPIIVGGTMMYYNVLQNGLNKLPKSDYHNKCLIIDDIKKNGLNFVYQKLQKYDLETANKLNPNDSQRIIRALEIYITTGNTMSSILLEEKKINNNLKNKYITISLEPRDKSILHSRIEKRLNDMIENGLVEEVQKLYNCKFMHSNLPSMKCIGYRQIWSYLSNQISFQDAKSQIAFATKNLAKRQMTWIKKFNNKIIIDCASKNIEKVLIKTISEILEKN